jgi:hypothetical protein
MDSWDMGNTKTESMLLLLHSITFLFNSDHYCAEILEILESQTRLAEQKAKFASCEPSQPSTLSPGSTSKVTYLGL